MLNKIIDELEIKIINSCNSTDLNNISSCLSLINNNTLICGIGGSKVCAIFLEKILNKKNNVIAKSIDAEEYFLINSTKYTNLIAISYSGKNNGIKRLMKTNEQNKYLLTTRKSKISNEKILNYHIVNRIKSFISFDDTIIPLSIFLCYYLNLKDFPKKLIPKNNQIFNIRDFDSVNIIYDYDSKTTAHFLETSFIEAGIASVTMHTKYSLCHGRSNIISNSNNLVIHLITKENELDKLIKEEIPKINNNTLIIDENENDPIIGDYKLLFKALYFLNYLYNEYNKEFVNVKYNKINHNLYHYKGELYDNCRNW